MNAEDKRRIIAGRRYTQQFIRRYGSVKVKDINEFITKMNKNRVSEEYLKSCKISAAIFEDEGNGDAKN